MLRRSSPCFRVGDFLSGIPTDSISRAIFTLGSARPPAATDSADAAENKCEDFARELMTHFHSVARSSTALRRQEGSNNGLRLGVRNTLLRSPLAAVAGVHLDSSVSFDSAPEVFAWASPYHSRASCNNGVVSAWVGGSSDPSSAALVAPPSSTVLVAMSANTVPTSSSNGAVDGSVRFYETTAVGKECDGRAQLKLAHAVTPSEKPSAASSSSSSSDEGKKNAALLLSVQARLNHAAFTYGTLRALARDAVLAGATATSIRTGHEGMLDASGVFHDRLAAIEAMSHMILAASHYGAFCVAESLYAAPSASSDFAGDLAYDSSMLQLLSRGLLVFGHQLAERTFLRHGPLVSDTVRPAGFVQHSFRGAEHWLAAVNCMDATEAALAAEMAALCCGAAGVQQAIVKAGSEGSNGGLVEQMMRLVGKEREPGADGGAFSDVHMNIRPKSSAVLKDFERLAKALSSSGVSAPSGGGNKKGDSSKGASAAAGGRSLLQQHAYASIALPCAAEIMGSACALYQSTNMMELMDGMQQQEQQQQQSASSSSSSSPSGGLSAEAAAAVRELYPGAAEHSTAPVYRTAAEAGAVAWLSLEVGLDASQKRRAQLLRDLTTSGSSNLIDNLAAHKSTHPVELPKSEQKKRPSMDEEEEAAAAG